MCDCYWFEYLHHMERNAAACAMEWSIELEKALRSKKPGRAVEAILQIGSRLQQWSREPEPNIAVYNMFDLVTWEDRLFSNTILLRLADAFKSDDKHIRVAVVKVFLSELNSRDRTKSKQYQGVLSKARVQNHHELLTRVKVVLGGGDPEARALALILLGCWAHFAEGSAQIRYMILSSMLSSHISEVKASIFAAACISQLADDFAQVFLAILVNIMTSTTSLAIKMAGARVFAKLGCSHSMAKTAYKAGLELASNSSEEDFLVAMLFSLSKLASKSVFISSEQVKFLCSFLSDKKSARVQETSLRCLRFIFMKGECLFTNMESVVRILVDALDEPMLTTTSHCDVLRLLRKIIFYVRPNPSFLDANEYSKLVKAVESAAQSRVMLTSLHAVRLLVDLSLQLSGKMEVESGVSSFSLLPEQVISLIMDQITSLLVDLSQLNSEVFQEIKGLLNLLLLIVREHSDLWSFLLEKICFTVELIMNMHEGVFDRQQIDMDVEGDKKNDISLRFAFILYGFMAICVGHLGQVVGITSEIFDKVKLLVKSVCEGVLFSSHSLLLNCKFILSCRITEDFRSCNNDGFPRFTFCEKLTENEIFTLQCAKKLLKNGDEWPAYKAGRHAACHGSWFAATLIFGHLSSKVRSGFFEHWLKSLFQFALAERKIQLLLLPQYGSGLINWLEQETILNLFSTEEQIKHHHAGSISEGIYYDKLLEAYQCLCSSGEALKSSVDTPVQAFCFQRWFLSLRAKMLGTIGSIVKLLLNVPYSTNDTAAIHETVEEFSKLSLTFERLSHEFDLIGTTFIGMDTENLNVISALALNCSLLAFCTGFAFRVPNLATSLLTENVDDFRTLRSVLIRNLIGRLWSVDRETSKQLTELFNATGGPNNCLHLLLRNKILDMGYEVRGISTLCRYAVSEVIRSQSKSNGMDEGTVLRVMEDGMQFLSNILMQWISIPFRVPKCFFCVRPCIGSELYATTDARKLDGISIPFGFHLSLNLCLQLKNIPPNTSVRITRMYCILYCGLSFQEPKHNEQKQQAYEAWEDDDIVEMQNKLLHYVTESSKNEVCISQGKTSSSCRTERVVQAFVKFEPNEKGQGFSNCLLDVSRFPVGSYRIKWYSCCVDSEGCFWSLLPLSPGPLFTVHQLPSAG
ncbi:uncharacterized protein LOC111447255 [Cucurbita moschata]|uniref:Uncharacterized protein LOC111447255 n=1 Tax=Cucurbita moschata TaxID=3662 RepID=A0A6J1FP76_CUCMO|nr:uncharacterized protein LOC111447255 [Cucurbita moschata]